MAPRPPALKAQLQDVRDAVPGSRPARSSSSGPGNGPRTNDRGREPARTVRSYSASTKFADTEVRTEVVHGRAGHHLLMASTKASLLVVGRRMPSGPHLGPVAHSVIHHSLCSVAVVPHA